MTTITTIATTATATATAAAATTAAAAATTTTTTTTTSTVSFKKAFLCLLWNSRALLSATNHVSTVLKVFM
jgi:hypothetical protein